MKLHKTRDGDVKVRGVEGAPDVARGDLYGVEPPVAVSWKDERGAWWSLRMTDEEAESLAASILEAVPSAPDRDAEYRRRVYGDPPESLGVPLRLQTQGGLPDRPESVGPIRETSHAVALAAFDEAVGHPLREAILAGFAEHRDADRLLRESQEVEAMARRFARALRRGR